MSKKSKKDERIILGEDEFFKFAAREFFSAYGFHVETEFEIFKQPKKVDVVVVNLEAKSLPTDFHLFGHWKLHNILSFKSEHDRVSLADLLDAHVYYNGYIKLVKGSNYENTTFSIVANQTPQKYFKQYQHLIQKVQSGFYQINFSMYQIYFININELSFSSIDEFLLLCFGNSTTLHVNIESLFSKIKNSLNKKIIALFNEFMYIRLQREPNKLKEKYMPAVKGIDITDIARPMIEKGRQLGIKEGRQEGQLEGSLRIALRLYKQGKNLKEIAELVELPLDFLKKELSKKKL